MLFWGLPCLMFLLLLLLLLCCCRGQVCWTSLHSGRSPHDGGQRFFTLALTRKGDGLSDHSKAVVCTIAVPVAVIVTVMYPLWTHAMTVIIAIDYVDMTRRPIFSCATPPTACEQACCRGRVTCVGVALLAACSSWQDKLLPPPPPCIILWPAPRWSPWLAGTVGWF